MKENDGPLILSGLYEKYSEEEIKEFIKCLEEYQKNSNNYICYSDVLAITILGDKRKSNL